MHKGAIGTFKSRVNHKNVNVLNVNIQLNATPSWVFIYLFIYLIVCFARVLFYLFWGGILCGFCVDVRV